MRLSTNNIIAIIGSIVTIVLIVIIFRRIKERAAESARRKDVDESQIHFDEKYYKSQADILDKLTEGFNIDRKGLLTNLKNISKMNDEELKITDSKFGIRDGETMRERLHGEWLDPYTELWYTRNTIVERLTEIGID